MILIEHAVVVKVDRERRILTDGSVLVDGRNIVQVGPAGAVRPVGFSGITAGGSKSANINLLVANGAHAPSPGSLITLAVTALRLVGETVPGGKAWNSRSVVPL